MAHQFIIVQNDDHLIVGTGGEGITAEGCRVVDIRDGGFTGDPIPNNIREMVNGHLLGIEYVKPEADAPCERCTALQAIDASAIADANLKIVVEYLQKYTKHIGG